MAQFSRRDFFNLSAMVATSVTISSAMSGCQIVNTKNLPSTSKESEDISFLHGVASGDPLDDKVIIWSRITPSKEIEGKDYDVIYEVAHDKEFSNIFRSGTVKTSSEKDYTLKVDVQDLKEETEYYYRFRLGGATSIVGKTKTLPSKTTNIEKAKLAIVSCANYPAGYFNVYSEITKRGDIDFVVHVGDYIYDYGMLDSYGKPAYATEDAVKIGRGLPKGSDTETISLRDYRNRYALYKRDVDKTIGTQAS